MPDVNSMRPPSPADTTRNELLTRQPQNVGANGGAQQRTEPQASETARSSLIAGEGLGFASLATATASYILNLARINQSLQITLEDSARREIAIRQAATIQADRAARQAAQVIGAARQALATNLIAGGGTAQAVRAATGFAATEAATVARLQAARQIFQEQQLRRRAISQARQQRLEAGLAFTGQALSIFTDVLGPAAGAGKALK